ncbi:MAG: hypothetical protein ACKOEX_01660 [Planctomycetia bacterium]
MQPHRVETRFGMSSLRNLVLQAMVAGLVAIAVPAAAQWGGFGYSRGGYASTATQAAEYGMSEMMRAQGYMNLQNSEAAKNWEETKTLDIQNRMRWTETYFEMRKTNREARAAEEGPPVTHDQAIRMAKMAAPPRLVSTQLDPVTGHIDYPVVLRDDIFAPYRDELDRLFAQRASSGGSMRFEEYQEIQTTVGKFVDALKEHVNKYPAGEYGRARTFLNSLAHEASMPSG